MEPQPLCCVILQRPQAPATLIAGHDVDWEQAMAAAEPVRLENTITASRSHLNFSRGVSQVIPVSGSHNHLDQVDQVDDEDGPEDLRVQQAQCLRRRGSLPGRGHVAAGDIPASLAVPSNGRSAASQPVLPAI